MGWLQLVGMVLLVGVPFSIFGWMLLRGRREHQGYSNSSDVSEGV